MNRSVGYVTAVTEQRNGLPVLIFQTRENFEEWLDRQPTDAAGAWLKLAKKCAGEGGLTKAEAIDAGLCYGWVDGQLQKYDDKYWLVRFTPRKARRRWSQVNKKRAKELLAEGRMRNAGMAQIEAAKVDGRWAAAYALQVQRKSPLTLRMHSMPIRKQRSSLQRSLARTDMQSFTVSALLSDRRPARGRSPSTSPN